MSLISCRECGTSISEFAKTCPSCGVSSPSLNAFFRTGGAFAKSIGTISIFLGVLCLFIPFINFIFGLPLIVIGFIFFFAPELGFSLLLIFIIYTVLDSLRPAFFPESSKFTYYLFVWFFVLMLCGIYKKYKSKKIDLSHFLIQTKIVNLGSFKIKLSLKDLLNSLPILAFLIISFSFYYWSRVGIATNPISAPKVEANSEIKNLGKDFIGSSADAELKSDITKAVNFMSARNSLNASKTWDQLIAAFSEYSWTSTTGGYYPVTYESNKQFGYQISANGGQNRFTTITISRDRGSDKYFLLREFESTISFEKRICHKFEDSHPQATRLYSVKVNNQLPLLIKYEFLGTSDILYFMMDVDVNESFNENIKYQDRRNPWTTDCKNFSN